MENKNRKKTGGVKNKKMEYFGCKIFYIFTEIFVLRKDIFKIVVTCHNKLENHKFENLLFLVIL